MDTLFVAGVSVAAVALAAAAIAVGYMKFEEYVSARANDKWHTYMNVPSPRNNNPFATGYPQHLKPLWKSMRYHGDCSPMGIAVLRNDKLRLSWGGGPDAPRLLCTAGDVTHILVPRPRDGPVPQAYFYHHLEVPTATRTLRFHYFDGVRLHEPMPECWAPGTTHLGAAEML